MRDAQRRDAAPRVGHVLFGITTRVRAKPPINASPQQVAQVLNYFDTFGERMINVPTDCDRAQAEMAEAAAKEQETVVGIFRSAGMPWQYEGRRCGLLLILLTLPQEKSTLACGHKQLYQTDRWILFESEFDPAVKWALGPSTTMR
jgi:hypothetical protein